MLCTFYHTHKNDNPMWAYVDNCWSWVMRAWGFTTSFFLSWKKEKKNVPNSYDIRREKTTCWLEKIERELKAQRMNLSCSQTKRPKKLGVKEIKQVEETLGQGPAWNQYQWYPIVPFLFHVTGLGSETWWGLLIWIWAQMRPMFFRNSRVDLEQAGLTQKGRRSTKVQKSHGNVLPGRRSYVL